jgi:hypothetical protein
MEWHRTDIKGEDGEALPPSVDNTPSQVTPLQVIANRNKP